MELRTSDNEYIIKKIHQGWMTAQIHIAEKGKSKGEEKYRGKKYHANLEQSLNHLFNRMMLDNADVYETDQINKIYNFVAKCKEEVEELGAKLQENVEDIATQKANDYPEKYKQYEKKETEEV